MGCVLEQRFASELRIRSVESVSLSTKRQLDDIMAVAFKRLLLLMMIWHFGSKTLALVASTIIRGK